MGAVNWWRAITGLPFAVNNPADPQQAPLLYRPVWHVGHLVFQGGIPKLKRSPMNGGGFLYARDAGARQGLVWNPYATPVGSLVGGGLMPSRPAFTTPLGGPNVSEVP